MREKEARNTFEGGRGVETITVYGSKAYGCFLFPTSKLLATPSFSVRWMDGSPSLTVPISQRTLVWLKKQLSINMSIQEGYLLGCISLLNVLEGRVWHYLVVKNNKEITSKSAPGPRTHPHACRLPAGDPGQTGTGSRLWAALSAPHYLYVSLITVCSSKRDLRHHLYKLLLLRWKFQSVVWKKKSTLSKSIHLRDSRGGSSCSEYENHLDSGSAIMFQGLHYPLSMAAAKLVLLVRKWGQRQTAKQWLSWFTSALRTIATDVLSRGEVNVGQQIVSSLFFSGKQQRPSL